MSQLATRYHCRHVHPSGHRCGSPALRGEPFCYHHHTTRRPPAEPAGTLHLPALEDRTTLQQALTAVLARIADGTLGPRRASLLLYGLQIAQNNLPPHRLTRPASETVEEITFDEHVQPLAPEQEIEATPHEPTLEEILNRQWEEDKAQAAEEKARAARDLALAEPRPAAILPTLNAVASTIGRGFSLDTFPHHRAGLQPLGHALLPGTTTAARRRVEAWGFSPTTSQGQEQGLQPRRSWGDSRTQQSPEGFGAVGALLSNCSLLFHTAVNCTSLFQDYAGDHLISHTLTRAVPSARRGLTSVFGMGTGVTLAVNSPANCRTSREVLTIAHN